MITEKDSRLENVAKVYDDAYAPDNFQAFIDGVEWGINEACVFLRSKKYQEFPGGPFERFISDEIIDELREKVLK